MNVITRDWIHDGFVFHHDKKSLNKNDICILINKWKLVLFNKGVKEGDTLGICSAVLNENYFSLFFAAAELGMKFVVFQRPEMLTDLENYKLEIFKPIDYVVYDSISFKSNVIQQFLSKFATCSFPLDTIDSTPIEIYLNQDKIKEIIWAKPESQILLTTSSGTTNKPKLISHTHEFFYKLCKRNAKVMNFVEDDNVIHIRNLHHGSSLGVFFLPALFACKNHYTCSFDSEDISQLTKKLVDHNITKLSVPYNSVIDKIFESEFEYSKLNIFNLSYIKEEWIKYCKQGKINSITSIFGCNETSGPIFLPTINSSTEKFDIKNYGNLLDNFYVLEVKDEVLTVNLGIYNKSVDTGDRFTLDKDGNYIFLGKKHSFRIDDIYLDANEFKNFVADHLQFEHIVVFDQEYEKIYLGILNDMTIPAHIAYYEDLNTEISNRFGDIFKISNVKYVVKERYLYGIKIDHEKLRNLFRN